MTSPLDNCCESIHLNRVDPDGIMKTARLHEFQGDVSNIIYCLKAMELINGGPAVTNDLKQKLIHCIENLEVPIW